MDDKAAQSEAMPESIGRYKVLDSLGFGAMGAVYKAYDPVIKRNLAIKTIRLDIPRQSPQYRSFIDRFYHEARISGTLSHPNIVTLFDIGEERGVPYLAMEFVDGQTVAALIETGHRFKPEKVINLASQIAAAIDYAHGKGVIHRDIKPANLMLHEGDRVKVTDFGIAKLGDTELTQHGTLLGTPSYMSPEQAMGDKLDGRSDIFSLGVCCFEMLSGEQPFPGTNVTSILYKLVHVDPIEPADLEMHGLVPQKWHEVFGRVLAKRPDDRYQTATAFVQDLEFCLGAWFGGLGTDETIAEAPEPTISMHVAPEDNPSTVTMKGPPPVADIPEPSPATVVMKAPPPAPVRVAAVAAVATRGGPPAPVPSTEPATVVMKAQAAPAKPAAAVAMRGGPAAPAPSSEPATVVMKAQAAPAKPAAAVATRSGPPAPVASTEPPTVVMKEKAAPRRPAEPARTEPVDAPLPPTVRMVAPLEETVTLRVSPAAARPLPPKTEPVLTGLAQKATARPPVPTTPPVFSPPPVVDTQALPAAVTPPVVIPATPRAGVPAGLVIGGGALALLLGLGAAVLLLRAGPTDVPAASVPPSTLAANTTPSTLHVPPSPATLANGVLLVETTPPGAVVTVNGQSRGVAPVEMTGLAAGDYEVRVELKGYDGKTQTVTLSEAESRAELRPVLNRTAPALGTADILSTPFGAAVTVDGAAAGQTPLLQFKLKPGTRKVEVAKEGYEPWSGTLAVEAGKKARLDTTLKAIVVAPPTPVPQIAEVVDTSLVYNNLGSEVDSVAKRVSGSSPSYPSDLPKLRSGESASVTVSFVVTDAGDVLDPKVVESGGSKILDEAVLGAIRSWKYSPAAKRGVKVKVRITQKQTFRAG